MLGPQILAIQHVARLVTMGLVTAAGLLTHLAAQAAPTETVLYNFVGGGDGALPEGDLITDAAGVLYSTTSSGGTGVNCQGGCGTVFKLVPPATSAGTWTEEVLYSFHGAFDGISPQAGLIADATGALYGTTRLGGSIDNSCLLSFGCGTVFKLTPPSTAGGEWKETVLHRFTYENGDGAFPLAGLIADASGALYGTTEFGGRTNANCPGGCGTVFKLIPPAKAGGRWKEQVLYSFQGGSDGAFPTAALIADMSGTLYGTTGGCTTAGCGTAFKLTPPVAAGGDWTETVLHIFGAHGGSDGASPVAGLITDATGALYGTTREGGGSGCSFSFGCGTAFKLTPPATASADWTEQVLYRFKGNSDGANPVARLAFGGHGALFGTTNAGGNTGCINFIGCGTVFKLTPPAAAAGAWSESVLHTFAGTDGANPDAGLIAGQHRRGFGTTNAGGTFGKGTVFEIAP